MRNLDNLEIIENIDKSDMRDLLRGFPKQCDQAFRQAEDFALPESFGRVKNVVTSGMGGSAIGGDLLRAVFSGSCSVPVVVNRNYSVPEFVGKDTLFIAVSFSGNTEETLSAFTSALGKGAKIIAMSSGGKLQEYSKEAGVPHFLIPIQGIQPRCALGYLFLPLVSFLSKLGLIPDSGDAIREAVKLLSEAVAELAPDVPAADNQAKRIAQAIYGKLPVIYASQNCFDIVAMRWKGQINENAKTMAFYNAIPEMNHNEIVGWGIPEDITRKCAVIFLYDDSDSEKIRKRMDITSNLIAKEVDPVITVKSRGDSPLAKALYFVLMGDFVSYYLAVLNGVDPTPIERISLLKSMLGA